MTLHAFSTANLLNGNFIKFTIINFFLQFFILTVKRIVMEVDLPGPVTINAPAHRQVRYLHHPVHFSYIAMAFNTVDLSNTDMLSMTEKHMIRKVMNAIHGIGFLF